MALDIDTVLNAVIQVLKDNTTTMASSLTTASDIKKIQAGDARSIPIPIDQYPTVMVQLMREEEEFAQIGQRNNLHTLTFSIVPLVYEGSSALNSDKDVRTIAKNIKAVLKSNITLSATAISSLPRTVDYFAAELNGTYCSGAVITLETRHLST